MEQNTGNGIINTSTVSLAIIQGENNMAEVDTQLLSNQHSDIRFEQQRQTADVLRQMGADTNEIVREGLKESFNARGDTKDTRYDLGERIGNQGDRIVDRVVQGHAELTDRFFTVGRDTADLRAQVIQAIDVTKMATEMNALKGIIEGQKNTTYLSDKITDDGEKTRALINDLKYHDLNRGLVERNAAIVELESERRHWRHRYEDGQSQNQWAALQSQLQAFQSQLQETRQGMVNFGTMAGVGQSSTSNNVR